MDSVTIGFLKFFGVIAIGVNIFSGLPLAVLLWFEKFSKNVVLRFITIGVLVMIPIHPLVIMHTEYSSVYETGAIYFLGFFILAYIISILFPIYSLIANRPPPIWYGQAFILLNIIGLLFIMLMYSNTMINLTDFVAE